MSTTAKERYEVLARMERYGIAYEDRESLRRIAMTLHWWHELECGVENGMVERDETTGKCFWVSARTGKRFPTADRETGALKRLAVIMKRYNRRFKAHVQGDPRGAALYLVPLKELKGGKDINAYYSNGLAIY